MDWGTGSSNQYKSSWVFPKKRKSGEYAMECKVLRFTTHLSLGESVCCQTTGPQNNVSVTLPEARIPVFIFMLWQLFRYYPRGQLVNTLKGLFSLTYCSLGPGRPPQIPSSPTPHSQTSGPVPPHSSDPVALGSPGTRVAVAVAGPHMLLMIAGHSKHIGNTVLGGR